MLALLHSMTERKEHEKYLFLPLWKYKRFTHDSVCPIWLMSRMNGPLPVVDVLGFWEGVSPLTKRQPRRPKKEKGYHQFSLNHFSCKFRSRTPKTSKYKSRQFLLFALWETHSLKGGFDWNHCNSRVATDYASFSVVSKILQNVSSKG